MSGSKKKQFSIKYISEYIDASIDGDVDLEINKISTIEDAEHGSITFLANSKYNKLIDTCLLYTSPSPRDTPQSRMPSSA